MVGERKAGEGGQERGASLDRGRTEFLGCRAVAKDRKGRECFGGRDEDETDRKTVRCCLALIADRRDGALESTSLGRDRRNGVI